MQSLAVGEVVCLKSGGPEMTVTAVISDGTVNVSWFSGRANDFANYPASALELASEQRERHTREIHARGVEVAKGFRR